MKILIEIFNNPGAVWGNARHSWKTVQPGGFEVEVDHENIAATLSQQSGEIRKRK